jgi:hypothetical protein
MLRRQMSDGNIDVASQERKKEKSKQIAAVYTHLLEGVLEDSQLDQNNDECEEQKERNEEGKGKWEIVHVSASVGNPQPVPSPG